MIINKDNKEIQTLINKVNHNKTNKNNNRKVHLVNSLHFSIQHKQVLDIKINIC